jgi:hypothetical protein
MTAEGSLEKLMSDIIVVIIPLTQGFNTVVDEIDEDLSEFEWHIHSHGYAVRTLPREDGVPGYSYMHREIMERILARPITTNEHIDHINREKLCNLRMNLRIASISENARNTIYEINNESGFIGVTRNGRGWTARIRVNNVQIYLGTYTTKEEARKVYLDKYYALYGEYPPERRSKWIDLYS